MHQLDPSTFEKKAHIRSRVTGITFKVYSFPITQYYYQQLIQLKSIP